MRAPLAVAAAWILLVLTVPAVPWALLFDDSFYYFELAQRLVAGEGATFDGRNATNGFHPLWLLVCAGLTGFTGLAPAKAALVLQAAMFGATWEVLRRRWALDPWVVGLAIAGPAVVKTWVNGLESGLVLPLHAALLLWRGPRWGWAILASLAFLARTDAGFLLLCAGVADLRARRPLFEKYALPAFTVVGFLVANQFLFGTPLQVSGQLKVAEPTVARAVWILALATFAVLLHRARVADLPATRAFLQDTGAYGAFCGVLLAWYTGVQSFPRLWYFGPLAMYGILTLAHLARDLASLGVQEGRPGVVRLLLLGPLALGILPQLSLLSPGATSVLRADAEAGAWITANLPAEAVVGAWDAGAIGAFAAQPVVNLDGVVNTYAFLEAVRSGTTPALLGDLTHVCNHAADEVRLKAHARAIVGPRVEGWREVRRWDYRFSGTTQEGATGRMATVCYALAPADATAPAASSPR